MACIYILFSKSTNKFYVGSSRENDSSSRLKSHNTSKSRSTKNGRPWIVIHESQCDNYTEARKRENFLKTGEGRKWISEEFGKLKN